jgi:hypothetical protein
VFTRVQSQQLWQMPQVLKILPILQSFLKELFALEAGDFHLFPDEMAKQIEAAYQSFSDNVIMVDFSNNKVEQGRVFTLKHLLKNI